MTPLTHATFEEQVKLRDIDWDQIQDVPIFHPNHEIDDSIPNSIQISEDDNDLSDKEVDEWLKILDGQLAEQQNEGSGYIDIYEEESIESEDSKTALSTTRIVHVKLEDRTIMTLYQDFLFPKKNELKAWRRVRYL